MKIQNKTNPTNKKILSSTIFGMFAIAVLLASVSVPSMQAFANTFRGDTMSGQYTVNNTDQAIGGGTGHCTNYAKVNPTTTGDTFKWSVTSSCLDNGGSGQTGTIDLVRIIVDGVTYDYTSAQCTNLALSTSCTNNPISLSQTSGSVHGISFTTYYRV
jgi:hypothetical protein